MVPWSLGDVAENHSRLDEEIVTRMPASKEASATQ